MCAELGVFMLVAWTDTTGGETYVFLENPLILITITPHSVCVWGGGTNLVLCL
jgi:hypothetical protein